MKNIDLAVLIDKYMAAETSREEEKILKNHLLKEENSTAHPELAALFEYFAAQKLLTPIPEFEDPSVHPAASEKKGKIIPLRMRSWLAAAASVLVLIFAYFYLAPSGTAASEDTYTDPETAAYSAAEALQLLSTEINKGKTLAKEQMNELDYINTFLTIY